MYTIAALSGGVTMLELFFYIAIYMYRLAMNKRIENALQPSTISDRKA
jgi:hypothetical protein